MLSASDYPASAPIESVGYTWSVTDDERAEPRDASEIGSEAARAAWAEAARPVLVATAGRYRKMVTYKQLAAAVQEQSGVTTSVPMHQWLGDVLARVTAESQSRGEPLLSSLCVSIQGSVGESYADAVERARGVRPEDPDDHAAHERLACYRHWEAEGLPRDGGTPLRTAHFKPVRKAAAKKAPAPRTKSAAPKAPVTRTVGPRKTSAAAPPPEPMRLCPNCFTEVPSTGICDYCD